MTDAIAFDARLIEVEMRFAYQEETLQVLNQVVSRQQRQIEQLETIYRQLLERVAQSSDTQFRGTAEDEIPPHY